MLVLVPSALHPPQWRNKCRGSDCLLFSSALIQQVAIQLIYLRRHKTFNEKAVGRQTSWLMPPVSKMWLQTRPVWPTANSRSLAGCASQISLFRRGSEWWAVKTSVRTLLNTPPALSMLGRSGWWQFFINTPTSILYSFFFCYGVFCILYSWFPRF